MDRRKFLTKSSMLGAGLVGITGVSDTRLYGQPTSVASDSSAPKVNALVPHMLRLHYALEGAKAPTADSFTSLTQLVRSIFVDENLAVEFAANPEEALANIGLTGSVNTSSPEFHAVRLLANPTVRQAAKANDHLAFLKAVRSTQASAIQSDQPDLAVASEPCCANAIVNVNALVNINVAGTATVYAVAIALLAVSVVVFVAVIGDRPELPVSDEVATQNTLAVAKVLGGAAFSNDVMHVEARSAIQQALDGLKNGTLQPFSGISNEEMISGLQRALDVHFA